MVKLLKLKIFACWNILRISTQVIELSYQTQIITQIWVVVFFYLHGIKNPLDLAAHANI